MTGNIPGTMPHIDLPPGFIFGAATSAYQIEGGWDADGKGASIWDAFTRRPGRIRNGHSGDRACRTYDDFQSDIEIMRRLGLDAYRFSVAWSRVLPHGRGEINAKGLDYYDRLVDALLAAGITPFPTLFHWDFPQALEESIGGFAHRESAAIFADYVAVVVRRLGDRVRHWITLNEPWVHATFGYITGGHAPGRRNPWAYLRVIHHQLLSHGLAVERIRSLSPAAQVGISVNLTPFYPASDGEKDHAAAGMADQLLNRIILDPLFHGRYPEQYWAKLRLFQPKIKPGDMDVIARPVDFLGVNYYTRSRVRHHPLIPLFRIWTDDLPIMTGKSNGDPGVTYSDMGWEVYPAGLFELLQRLKKEYGNPTIYITENGAAFADTVAPDGRIRDEARRDYLAQHLAVTGAATRAGVNVRGYFVWSLLDNFEWTHGYDKRFGIVHVDYDTQRRTIKDSGYWYAGAIRAARETAADSAGSRGTESAATASQ